MAFDPTTATPVSSFDPTTAKPFDPTTAQQDAPTPTTPVSDQVAREAARPDLANNLQQDIQNNPGFPDPLTAAQRGLTAVGAGMQSVENAVAAPTVNALRALRGEQIGPTDILGHTLGQKKAEIGDIGREVFKTIGLPDWATEPFSATAGLAATGGLDVAGAGKMAASGVDAAAAGTIKLAKSTKAVLDQITTFKNSAEAQHLIDGGYLRGVKDIFKSGGQAAQTLGNDLVEQWRTKLMEPARRAQEALAPQIAAAQLPDAANKQLYEAVQGTLAGERNTIAVQRVLDTDIGRAPTTKTVGGKAPTSKTVTSTSSVEYPGQKVVDEKGMTQTTGPVKSSASTQQTAKYNKELDDYGPSDVSKIARKRVVTQVAATPSTQVTSVKPRTVKDLLSEAAYGKDISAKEWDSVSQELKKISGAANGSDPTASKVAAAIDDVLQQHVPALKNANDMWAAAKAGEDHLTNLVGGVERQMQNGKMTFKAKNPGMLYSYFENQGDSVLQGAAQDLDRLLGYSGNLNKIKDVAAYGRAAGTLRPFLTSVGLAGGGAAALGHFGVNPVITGAMMAGLMTESSPWLSAKGGRALLNNEQRIKTIMKSPAGRFLVGQGALRQATGRNDQP